MAQTQATRSTPSKDLEIKLCTTNKNICSRVRHFDLKVHTFNSKMVLGSKFAKKNLDHYKNVYEDTDSRIQAWINLFFVWKGSVTKLLWQDLLVFLIIYFSLSILYWKVLLYDEASAQYFEMICIYCERQFQSLTKS